MTVLAGVLVSAPAVSSAAVCYQSSFRQSRVLLAVEALLRLLHDHHVSSLLCPLSVDTPFFSSGLLHLVSSSTVSLLSLSSSYFSSVLDHFFPPSAISSLSSFVFPSMPPLCL